MFTHKLTTVVLLIAVLILASALGERAPIPSTSAAEPAGGEITVIGKGEAVGEPDRAQVQVGVDILADTVQQAASQNQAVIEKILAALQSQGVAAKDIQTANFSVWVEQRYMEKGPPEIAGYHVSNQVNVTVREIEKISNVLAAVMEAGANNIFGVSFSVADPAALEAEARARAIEDARARAEDLARLGQVELGQIKLISEIITQPGPPPFQVVMEPAAAAPGPSIAPGQLSFPVQLQVTYYIR